MGSGPAHRLRQDPRRESRLTDVYTLTKAFAERAAEQLWAGNGHRLSIVRPAIIESALRHPYPGWIDGFKVADPLILAYGRGQLPEFLGLPDSALDIIPVDFVVNVILAVAERPPAAGSPEYFHVSSGASNPLPMHRMFDNINMFFKAHPMPQPGQDGHIVVPIWTFPGGRKVEKGVLRAQRRNESRAALARAVPVLAQEPGEDRAGAAAPRRPRLARQLQRALPRLRADRDDLRRRQDQGPQRLDPGRAPRRHRLRRRGHRLGRLLSERPFPGDHRDDPRVRGSPGRARASRQGSAAAQRRRRRLRPRGHGRRHQPRRAVPVGALGRLPQGRLARRVPQPRRQRAHLPAGRAAGPGRVHPRVPSALQGHARRAAREGRLPRLRRHAPPAHEGPRRSSASANTGRPATAPSS
ncbi:MAG: SDR family oxidoreductase [Galbitalea sp.]